MYIKHRSKLYTAKALIEPISIIALIIPKPCEQIFGTIFEGYNQQDWCDKFTERYGYV